ncbi:MAG: site-specific DNA-methyltransferase [Pirellulales bacterium]|nr:site-specific DNA-methyltransferase [Pirellulales bacterium]
MYAAEIRRRGKRNMAGKTHSSYEAIASSALPPQAENREVPRKKAIASDWRIICDDVAIGLGAIDNATVDLTITSPPYYRHRDYGVEGQIGAEPHIRAYVDQFRRVFSELLRVTTPVGTCFVVIGDTYRHQELLLIPHRLALLAAECGWIVRNDIIWSKLDPPPESPRNRWRTGHEHILFLTKNRSRYKFNADSIRVPYAQATIKRWGNGQVYGGQKSSQRQLPKDSRMRHGKSFRLNPNGCIPTDVWTLPAGDSSVRHYATFPERLIQPIVEVCSEPGDLVLDPFAGSGTTCRVAILMGRRTIGIELNPEYAELARKQLKELSTRTD